MAKKIKLDIDAFKYAVGMIRAIEHPKRISIIKLLEENDALNINQIVFKMELEQIELAHHLALLLNYDIIKRKRIGLSSIYSLNATNFKKIIDCVDNLLDTEN